MQRSRSSVVPRKTRTSTRTTPQTHNKSRTNRVFASRSFSTRNSSNIRRCNDLNLHSTQSTQLNSMTTTTAPNTRRRFFGTLGLTSVNKPVEPSTTTSSSEGCASSSCCGGGCKSEGPTSSDRVKCDPYGLNNQPLDTTTLNLQLEFVLEHRWKYDTEKNTLSRSYNFAKATQPQPSLQSVAPGAPSGPRHGPGACFTFLQAINNISLNNDHFPYHIEVIPRKAQVDVFLKTIGRPGVTHADINLAVLFDSFYSANMQMQQPKLQFQQQSQSQQQQAQQQQQV